MKSRLSVKGKRIRTLGKKKYKKIEEVIKEADKELEDVRIDNEERIVDGEFNLERLNCFGVNQIAEFKELKKNIEDYLEDCKRPEPRMHLGKSAEWKQNLYTSVYNLLTECIFTRNLKVQQEYLAKVYEWFYKKIGEKAPNLEEKKKIMEKTEENRKITKKIPVFHVDSKKFSNSLEKIDLAEPNSEQHPMNSNTQSRIDSIFKEYRLKDLSEKRELDSMHKKVRNWVISQPKRQEEYLRARESAKLSSKFKNREAKSATPNFSQKAKKNFFELLDPDLDLTSSTIKTKEIESSSKKAEQSFLKIAAIREKNKKILDSESVYDPYDSILNVENEIVSIGTYSNSVKYCKNDLTRVRTAGLASGRVLVNKGLYGVSRPLTTEKCRRFEEIEAIKSKLAKKNILCDVQTLKYGLMLDDDLPEENLNHKFLPALGAGLLSYSSIKPKTPPATINKKKL